VDISAAMLERARANILGDASPARTEFIRADLCDLSEIADGRFALAVALGDPICSASSPPKAMKEIRRVLSNGGTLVATFDNRLAAIEHYLEKGDPRELEQFLRHGRTNWLTRDRSERFELHTFSPNDVRKLVEHAGLEIAEMIGKTVLPMRHFRRHLESPDVRRTWAAIEKSISRDACAMGRASHIQIACRKP
jgi:SAM-dependent methyltransferase